MAREAQTARSLRLETVRLEELARILGAGVRRLFERWGAAAEAGSWAPMLGQGAPEPAGTVRGPGR